MIVYLGKSQKSVWVWPQPKNISEESKKYQKGPNCG